MFMNFTSKIPNTLTLLNLFSGCMAMLHVSEQQYPMAFAFVCLGIFFDFFDGFFARLFHVQSALGLQLDSLADMVTSGVVPGFVMYQLLANTQTDGGFLLWNTFEFFPLLPLMGFVITLASCYRLGKFNIDTRQTDSFIGLPTPANALLILSIPLLMEQTEYEFLITLLTHPYFLLGVTFLSAFLLNAEIPLFSLKFKSTAWEDSKYPFLLLGTSLVLLVFFQWAAIPLIILIYVVLSLIQNRFSKS